MGRQKVPETELLWRALADPTRRAILDALRDGPRTTRDLAGAFPTTRFAVMKHLGTLVAAELVTVERRGRERLNHLNPVPLRQAHDRWIRPFAVPVADSLLRLAGTAEGGDDAMTTGYGLDLRARHRVRAAAGRTWDALLELARWWPRCWADHERLLFEPRLGGRLGVVAGTGFDAAEGALWGVVTELRPGRALVLDGAMGLPGPVLGRWRIDLEPAGGETVATVEHRVLGPVDEDDRACFAARWPGVLDVLAGRAEHPSP